MGTAVEVKRILLWSNVVVATGEEYEAQFDISTRAGYIIPKGSRLKVLEQTVDAPHNELGPYGYNWRCETFYGTTVWTTLESCIERGLFKKVDET